MVHHATAIAAPSVVVLDPRFDAYHELAASIAKDASSSTSEAAEPKGSPSRSVEVLMPGWWLPTSTTCRASTLSTCSAATSK